MHLERLEEQVRLVAHALLEALVLGAVEVVLQDGLVVRVRALVDDDARALARREAADVGETLSLVSIGGSIYTYIYIRGKGVPAP